SQAAHMSATTERIHSPANGKSVSQRSFTHRRCSRSATPLLVATSTAKRQRILTVSVHLLGRVNGMRFPPAVAVRCGRDVPIRHGVSNGCNVSVTEQP